MYDDKNISKLYRYEALIQAIDFFTQKFDVNQLANYAFDFANEILTLNSSALFINQGDSFNLVKSRNYSIKSYSIPNTEKLQRIATFYGSILKSNFDTYFNASDIKVFDTQLIIPLIIQDLLYGFIVSNGKAVELIDEDDLIISKALMQLINNSLENSKNFSDLQQTNKRLDQKIFNLFSINQSSRMLLSELDLRKLYSLSIDIFSELTSSKITSFGLYDEILNRVVIKGYKNVYSSEKQYHEFELVSREYKGYKLVYNYKSDFEELSKLFVNCKDFKKLEAEYIILIVKKDILGFVTISKSVNDRSYDEGLFELIESLAASTYISFTNAIFFQEITRQKSIIEQKLSVLTKLNSLIKNINSCVDIDELCDVTIKTLKYGFGIKKAFIALKNKDEYIIRQCIGFEPPSSVLCYNEAWGDLANSEVLSIYTKLMNSTYFDEAFLESVGETNCLVISPITVANEDIDGNSGALGYIVVLHTRESLREEEVLLVDTISNSIAPIINNMNYIEHIKQEYILDPRAAFIKQLHAKFDNRINFLIDFYLYYKRIEQKPFCEQDISAYDGSDSFYFDGYLFVLSEIELDEKDFDGSIETVSVEQMIECIKSRI